MSDMMHQDVDPQETKEWIDALESVLEEEGVERAHYLLEKLIDKARRSGLLSAGYRHNLTENLAQ